MKTFSKVMKFIGIAQMTLGIAGMLSCIVTMVGIKIGKIK